jgi:hypothetical protein
MFIAALFEVVKDQQTKTWKQPEFLKLGDLLNK